MWFSDLVHRVLGRPKARPKARDMPAEEHPTLVNTAELIALAKLIERPPKRKARAAAAGAGVYREDDEPWTVELAGPWRPPGKKQG